MGDGFFGTLKRFILWDYRRGSLQYDIMCVIILAFIFLTPAHVFRDGPKPKEVVMLPGEKGTSVFWIEPELLEGYAGAERTARVEALMKAQSKGGEFRLERLEQVAVSEDETKGYLAFAVAGK